MKYHILSGLGLIVCAQCAQATLSVCQQKTQDIQHEIVLARQHHNARRVNGLEHALREIHLDCAKQKKRVHNQRSRHEQHTTETRHKSQNVRAAHY